MRSISSTLASKFTVGRRATYERLDDSSSDSEKAPKSSKSEKSSGHPLGGNASSLRPRAKETPPTIPPTLKGTKKGTRKPARHAEAKKKPDVAARMHNTATPASQAQTLPSKLTLLLNVFGLSQAEALDVSEEREWSYFTKMLASTQPIVVNPDGQLHMCAESAWAVMASIPTGELRFKFLAALDASSLVALIKQMEAWRFHDNVSAWDGPATNDRLAAMMAFDVTYTRAFMGRLTSARDAADSELGPILGELGLLLAAAPIWMVGDLIKRLGKESRLPEFLADMAFLKRWNAAQENVTLAEEKFRKDPETKEYVRAFLEEMKLSDERDRALILESPPLLSAIENAQDREVFGGDAIVIGDKLGLFRELVNTAPALAWRYLSSTPARRDLMGHHRHDVQRLLEQIADTAVDGVRAEVDVLVSSVVKRVAEVESSGKDSDLPAKLLADWMDVLPPPVRSLLKQALGEAFKPASIVRWLQRSEHLNAVWQATATLDANASLVG